MKAKYIVAIGLAVLAAGCSSSKPAVTPSSSTSTTVSSTAPTTTVSSATAAQQFLAAAKVSDAAYATWKAEVTGKTTISQVIGPCATYAAELTTFDNALMRIAVTGKVATDIHTLVADDGVVIKDLNSVSTQTLGSLSKEAAQLRATGRKAILAGDVVRSDLGLPPS